MKQERIKTGDRLIWSVCTQFVCTQGYLGGPLESETVKLRGMFGRLRQRTGPVGEPEDRCDGSCYDGVFSSAITQETGGKGLGFSLLRVR